MAASKSIIQVAGSGTGDIEPMPANGPPGMAAMVSVAPAPMVRVPCVTDVAVKLLPANRLVLPVPLIVPTVCVPPLTWNVAVVADVDMAEAVAIWPVEANSSKPLLILVAPV